MCRASSLLILAALAAGLAVARSARAQAPGDESEPLARPSEKLVEETYYLRLFQGRAVAVIRSARYEVSDGDRKLLRLVTDTEQRIVVGGHAKVTTSRRETLTDELCRGISLRESTLDNGARREVEVTVSGGKVVFESRLPGSTEKREAEVTEAVYFDLDGEVLAAAGQLRPGGEMTARVVAVEQAGIAKLVAKVAGKRVRELEGGASEEAYLIEVSNAGAEGMAWEVLADGRGRMLELDVGGIVTRKVPKDEARLPAFATRISNEIETGPLGVPAARARKVVLLVRLPRDIPGGAIPDCPGQRAAKSEKDPGAYVVVLTERMPDGRSPSVKLSERERAELTASTALIPAQHPELKAAAERAAAGETEPMIIAGRLVRFVARRLANFPRGASTASALEAYRSGSGDCTEHALLMVALARALGMPARPVTGLVHSGDAFVFHQWAEVHIDDRWVECDPSRGLLGLPACYLRLGTGSEEDADYRARALLFKAGAEIEILQAE